MRLRPRMPISDGAKHSARVIDARSHEQQHVRESKQAASSLAARLTSLSELGEPVPDPFPLAKTRPTPKLLVVNIEKAKEADGSNDKSEGEHLDEEADPGDDKGHLHFSNGDWTFLTQENHEGTYYWLSDGSQTILFDTNGMMHIAIRTQDEDAHAQFAEEYKPDYVASAIDGETYSINGTSTSSLIQRARRGKSELASYTAPISAFSEEAREDIEGFVEAGVEALTAATATEAENSHD